VEIIISKMHKTLAIDSCSLGKSESSPDIGPERLVHNIEIDLSDVLDELLHSPKSEMSVSCCDQ